LPSLYLGHRLKIVAVRTGEVTRGDPIRVVLIDDHRVFADALAIGLGATPGLDCVAVAGCVSEGIDLAARRNADVAVVDLQVPESGGLSAVSQLAARRPALASVVLTAYPRADLARAAREVGAVGFLGKEEPLAVLTATIRSAARGESTVVDAAEDPIGRLRITARELDVLRELSRGKDATTIAASLGVSLHTARHHIRSLLVKLNVQSQLDAVVTADRLGVVSVSAAC
jgi:DNA-binding NarL/FixJ family response regulator